MKRSTTLAITAICLLVMSVAAATAWRSLSVQDAQVAQVAQAAPVAQATQAAAAPALEIRWHGGGIILQGAVRDAVTQRALAEGAAARLGGETEQVVDWLDITPDALAVADPAALAQLIRLGQEGWQLQRRPAEGWLAVPHLPKLGEAEGAQARALLQAAFGQGVATRLVLLP
ncbi:MULTISPECIES: hypothetical protein [unclassified Variovorax]|uniref:hypothetical protein n=1 Tax=unclassified Variovorax TaxID=663243 RepID=UPI000B85F2C9|nr:MULTISPECIES: hypothetical protein [unclassified Variovorax]